MENRLEFSRGDVTVVYLGHDMLGYSDLSGGAVERANVRAVMALPWLEGSCVEMTYEQAASLRLCSFSTEDIPATDGLLLVGGYGSRSLCLREGTEVCRDVLAALDSYPVFDEEVLYAVEDELFRAAWDSWIRDDLVNGISNDRLQKWAAEQYDRDLLEWFRDAAAKAGVDVEYVGAEVHVDLGCVQPEFSARVLAEHPERVTDIGDFLLHDVATWFEPADAREFVDLILAIRASYRSEEAYTKWAGVGTSLAAKARAQILQARQEMIGVVEDMLDSVDGHLGGVPPVIDWEVVALKAQRACGVPN